MSAPGIEQVAPAEVAADATQARRGARRGRVQKLPAWADAIPDDLNLADDLEVIATLGFRSLAVSLVRVLADRFMKVDRRVALVSQINAQMQAAKSMRRIWIAEGIIKGNARAIAENRSGKPLEERTYATRADGTSQASRPAARRGRPRKR